MAVHDLVHWDGVSQALGAQQQAQLLGGGGSGGVDTSDGPGGSSPSRNPSAPLEVRTCGRKKCLQSPRSIARGMDIQPICVGVIARRLRRLLAAKP